MHDMPWLLALSIRFHAQCRAAWHAAGMHDMPWLAAVYTSGVNTCCWHPSWLTIWSHVDGIATWDAAKVHNMPSVLCLLKSTCLESACPRFLSLQQTIFNRDLRMRCCWNTWHTPSVLVLLWLGNVTIMPCSSRLQNQLCQACAETNSLYATKDIIWHPRYLTCLQVQLHCLPRHRARPSKDSARLCWDHCVNCQQGAHSLHLPAKRVQCYEPCYACIHYAHCYEPCSSIACSLQVKTGMCIFSVMSLVAQLHAMTMPLLSRRLHHAKVL